MERYYHGTKTALDWVIAHHYFHRVHYTWLSEAFFPYRLNNPKSSNPLEIYQDIYKPWKDRDPYDNFLNGRRLAITKSINAKVSEGVLDAAVAARLKDACDRAPIEFLYPIVFRVKIDEIAVSRQRVAGSGRLVNSSECLVEDLAESEFDILFLDYQDDSDFRQLVDSVAGGTYLDSYQVMEILERRCSSVSP